MWEDIIVHFVRGWFLMWKIEREGYIGREKVSEREREGEGKNTNKFKTAFIKNKAIDENYSKIQ